MKIFAIRSLLALFMGIFLAIGGAQAQIEASLTLKGSVEDMIPILELLKDLGIGSGPEGGGGLELELHSTFPSSEESEAGEEMSGETTDTEEVTPEPAPESTDPVFSTFVVAPGKGAVGQEVMVTATLHDPKGMVDTVALTIGELEGTTADLYDNGSNGDETAADGVWSLRAPVPEVEPGVYTLNLAGYDLFGQAVLLETDDGTIPLQERVQFEVTE